MATFPEKVFIPLAQAVAGTVDVQETDAVDMSQWSEKGYSYLQGAGKAFTATLQGSVLGDVWTDVDALAASADGVWPAYYNYARVKVTGAGLLGTGTRIVVAGKVL